ncbi:hypothetical protein [Rheinheimera sp. NSM]|jgi:hypothetical protein|uniref:hypothetical protein n=1 Tax=Rheinheimera sp. NSM TaxID=3457884 RepID=UPI004036B19B
MDDKTRETLVIYSAYGYLGCLSAMMVVAMIFGKPYGRAVLYTLIPLYSLYYAVMYWRVCRGYKDQVKRISAFGIIGRGTFVGAMYYLSLFFCAVLLYLFVSVFFAL